MRIISIMLSFVISASLMGCSEIVDLEETPLGLIGSVEVVDYEEHEPRVTGQRPPKSDEGAHRPPRPEDEGAVPSQDSDDKNESKYSVSQAISDQAQLTTIAFSGLAFLTGTEGADAFFPPGKVADFFGFQYMRDIDISGYGHNTTFLSKVAANVLYIMTDDQRAQLIDLAEEQETLYEDFGYGRLNIIDAFRTHYEEDAAIDAESLMTYSAYLYDIDGQLSYKRAEVLGDIIRSFSEEQKAYLAEMDFNNSSTWPDISEESLLDKSAMSHTVHVAVMTYASELFSWYKGSLEADAYFCPERHGTYFGGFYMKDYPAMGNPDYFISTAITGDSGQAFVDILTEEQQTLITSIVEEQKDTLQRIVEIRQEVAQELRKFMIEDSIDEEKVMTLMKEYGILEGELSLLYASRFSQVGHMLTKDQMDEMMLLRNQYVFPEGTYFFSEPIPMTSDINGGFLLD